jgi:hypothetical protein
LMRPAARIGLAHQQDFETMPPSCAQPL